MIFPRPRAVERSPIRGETASFVALCGETYLDSSSDGDVCGFVRRDASGFLFRPERLWPCAETRVPIQGQTAPFVALCGGTSARGYGCWLRRYARAVRT
jgi:hypothetical protein